MRHGKLAAALCVAFMAIIGGQPATASTPVAGFKEEVMASGLAGAIGMDWTPDGRMVIVEKRGLVKVLNPGGQVVTVLNLQDRVNTVVDRGLTGVAVDAAFAQNNYVYLLYTYDGFNKESAAPKTSHLTRIQLRPDNKVVNASTVPETVILGTWPTTSLDEACPKTPTNVQDCLPADGVSHVAGTVRAAPDGTLWIGSGDAKNNSQNNPDAFRTFNERSFAGKILHVDRNGRGLPGHPFCPATTDLTAACTKVFASGFRNPFRFNLATRGGLWVGDVGEVRFEELDHVVPGGSYGWPCYEGPWIYAPYQTNSQCQAHYASLVDRPPVWWYAHGDEGAAIIGGPEYQATAYPASFRGSIFAGEYVTGALNRVVVDASGNVSGVSPFATDWHGADLLIGPDGYLYTAGFNEITRIVPSDGNRPPVARATVTPYAGLAPLEAHFDGSTSSDPDGDALTYSWTFGDGTGATGPNPVHVYVANDRYTATLTVTDPGGLSASFDVLVVVGTRPPVIDVIKPGQGFKFRDGVPVALEAAASDPEDGTLPDSAVSWQITLQHNQHQHSLGTFTGKTAEFTPLKSHDADSFYLVDVTATDSDAVSTTVSFQLDPETVRLELATDPAGTAGFVYDGAPHPAPFVKQSVIGFETTIQAPPTMPGAPGQTLVFAGWSDGGAATHAITIPDHDLRLVARYLADATPPDTIMDSAPGATTRNATPSFYFHSTEQTPPSPNGFQCRMDAGAWFWCSSPFKSWKLTNKQHVFEVRAYDLAGNVDPTPARAQFIVTL